MLLGDQGADVIRIDPPGGPRWNTPANATWNRNKRSIVLDLKQPAGKEALLKLAQTAEALVYNVRPQAMKRLGLIDMSRLRALFEQIEPELYRYPAIDAPRFRAAVAAATAGGS